MKRKRSDTKTQLLRLCNLSEREWTEGRTTYREMQPADFLFQRLLSFLTPEDLQNLVKAWAEEN